MKLSIVLCGWHFKNEHLYRKLRSEAESYSGFDVRFYIASHKSSEEIDKSILNGAIRLGWNVLCFSNEGWDWGAYQQFLIWQKDKDILSDFYLFLHDDIVIKKCGFIQAFHEKIQDGFVLVGNSPTVSKKEKIRSYYPEDVLWAEVNGFPIKSNEWNVVRGSCFLTTKRVAENILIKMPIKKGADINLANSSLRIFGALVTDRFGGNAIGYIGEKPRSSFYIEEEHRGNNVMPIRKSLKSLIPPYIKTLIKKRILGYQRVDQIKQGTGLKLNLGCGQKCLPGYFNIDLDSPCADQTADILQLKFQENSIAEVLMIHTIEHIDYMKVAPFLERIYTWLKVDGQLILEFPDLIKCCRLILKRKNKPEEIQQSPLGALGLYGGNPKMSVHDYHKWGWTKTTMVPLLKKIGFRKIYVERANFHVAKRDTRLVTIK